MNATGGSGLSGKQWAGLGLAGLGGALPLLFGGSSDVDEAVGQLKKQAASAQDLSKTLSGQGQDLFGPVAQYLKGVTSSNRQDVLQATMPQRQRVIDQYATAKKAISEFTPRGGGQAAAGAGLQAKEASDLAETTATARQQGFANAGNLATQLQGLGLSAQQLASGDLNSILNAVQAQEKAKAEGWGGVGSALGTIAGFLFL